MFILRDQNGVMKARVKDQMVADLFKDGKLEQKKIRYEGRGPVDAFVLKEDMVFKLEKGEVGVTLYLWVGDRLVPDD